MRNSYKVLTAVAVAGLALAGGSAFTGAGLTSTAGTGFVGGTVSQTINGAVLSNVSYASTGNGAVSAVTLAFADANSNGKTVTASITDGTTPQDLVCPGTVSAQTITCNATPDYVGATSLSISVAN